MAGDKTAPARGRFASRRVRFRLPILAAALLTACASDDRGDFHFSGSITAPPQIQQLIERPNLVLYIVATNRGGVPVAVQKIVNPKLPVYYTMTQEDLVLPGPAWNGPLTVNVFVNAHGNLGVTRPGDMTGTHRGAIRTGERNADVIVDRKI